jgi:hypothetical protein
VDCAADRQSYVTVDVCASEALCDRVLGCVAPLCQTGEYRCEGPNLLRFNEARSGFVPLEICDFASHCDANSGRCLAD